MIMERTNILVFLAVLLSMIGLNSYAYDFAVENEDGVLIYYNYVNDGKELEVTSSPDYQTKYNGVVVIPETVVYMNRPRKVTSIGNSAFDGCGVTSVTIPNSVTKIDDHAFQYCRQLKSIIIPDGVESIGNYAFYDCWDLSSITIPSSLNYIGYSAFSSIGGDESFSALSSVIISDLTAWCKIHFYSNPLHYAHKLVLNGEEVKKLVLPKSLNMINETAFEGIDVPVIISMIDEPFEIEGKNDYNKTFSNNTFNNATLYVPKGTLDKYKSTKGWKDFLFIEEGTEDDNNNPDIPICSIPTINLVEGKLSFCCETENVDYHWSISTPNNSYGKGESVPFVQTIVVNVYASKVGFLDSEVNSQEFSASGLSGDVNGDGEVNVADHVKLSDIIMNKNQ